MTWRCELLLQRELLIRYLKSDLVRYLSEASDRQTGLKGLTSIADLTPEAIEQALAYRLVMGSEADAVLHAVENLLRSLPPTATAAWSETQGFISGQVSWQRTVERRQSTSDPTVFVSKVLQRRYDSPAARLLKAVLLEISAAARRSRMIGSASSESGLRSRSLQVVKYLKHPKLTQLSKDVREQDLPALERRQSLRPFVSYLRLARTVRTKSDPDTIIRLLESLILLPKTTATLFELYSAFRVVEAFELLGFTRVRPWGLLSGRAPLAELRRKDCQLTVHWQRSLSSLEVVDYDALLKRIAQANGLSIGEPRVDILLDFHVGNRRHIRLGEVKYYEDPIAGARAGIVQLAAYLHDAGPSFPAGEATPLAFVIAAGVTAQPAQAVISVCSEDQLQDLCVLLLQSIE